MREDWDRTAVGLYTAALRDVRRHGEPPELQALRAERPEWPEGWAGVERWAAERADKQWRAWWAKVRGKQLRKRARERSRA